MKVLVACEESQIVTIEFRELGHEAYSCDIEPCSGNHPKWHLQQDVTPLLKEKWDMIIAFPPCTHLCVSGAQYFEQKIEDGRQQQGIDFFNLFINVNCPKVAIENPIGVMNTIWRKPNQIIQPYQFGNEAQKTTCLWLKGLPLLKPTKIVSKGKFVIAKSGKIDPKWHTDTRSLPQKERSKIRSKTFPGIAEAMAQQWGNFSPLTQLLYDAGMYG